MAHGMGAAGLGCTQPLVHPRRAEIKDQIIRIIKKREPFRPFAPSILEERVRSFSNTSRRHSCYSRFLSGSAATIPAVTHTTAA